MAYGLKACSCHPLINNFWNRPLIRCIQWRNYSGGRGGRVAHPWKVWGNIWKEGEGGKRKGREKERRKGKREERKRGKMEKKRRKIVKEEERMKRERYKNKQRTFFSSSLFHFLKPLKFFWVYQNGNFYQEKHFTLGENREM